MPHRRRVQKGSFGGHFDELVKGFPHGDADQCDGEKKSGKQRRGDERHINDRLFEARWRRSREP